MFDFKLKHPINGKMVNTSVATHLQYQHTQAPCIHLNSTPAVAAHSLNSETKNHLFKANQHNKLLLS